MEAPTPGSCFHFHPLWDDVGAPAAQARNVTGEAPFSACLPSCMEYKDSLAPRTFLKFWGLKRGVGDRGI